MVRVSCKVHVQLSVLHHFSYLVDLSLPKILHTWAFLINARFFMGYKYHCFFISYTYLTFSFPTAFVLTMHVSIDLHQNKIIITQGLKVISQS